MIRIDGSQGEGGGQILRTALSLSALLGKPVAIERIRANREKPGLRPQHLLSVRALAAITGAEVEGASPGSGSLVFIPHAIRPGKYYFEVGTAGSACLVAAALLPPLLFASQRSEVIIAGGTHVPFSPVFQYFTEIFLPAIARMNGLAETDLLRCGWYPVGGGKIRLSISPCHALNAVDLTGRGGLCDLHFHVVSSLLPHHVAEREKASADTLLAAAGYKGRCTLEDAEADCPGNMVFLRARYENIAAGFSALGKKGKPAEEVAGEAVEAFLGYAGTEGPVDAHLADQLLLYMAIAGGTSTANVERFTNHLRTNAGIIEKFLPVSFVLDEDFRKVTVHGAGIASERVQASPGGPESD